MYSKLSDLITTISVLVFLAAILVLANSCEKEDRFRGASGDLAIQRGEVVVFDARGNPIVNPDLKAVRSGKYFDANGNPITDISQLSTRRGGLHTTGPRGAVAYALSMINGGRITTPSPQPSMQSQSGRYPTDRGAPQQTRSTSHGGLSGQVDVIAIYDESEQAESSAGALNSRVEILPQTQGVQGGSTINFSLVDGVSEDSYIDVIPTGNSVLVSRPFASTITQLLLDDSGNILKQYHIGFCPEEEDIRSHTPCPKPTRFVAMHDFNQNPYVFVATDQGIETLIFDLDHTIGQKGYKVGRVLGARQNVSYNRSRDLYDSGENVFDVAISADNSIVYVSTRSMVYYKDTRDLLAQLDNGGTWQRTGYQAKRIHTPIAALPTMPLETVAVLTDRGIDFLNMATSPTHFKWDRMYSVNPVDLSFHPDGYSIMVLTGSDIYRFPLRDGQIGMQADPVPVGSGSVDFAIDKRRGNFLAIAHKGSSSTATRGGTAQGMVNFAKLDKNGIVSRPGKYDKAPTSGVPIAVAVR